MQGGGYKENVSEKKKSMREPREAKTSDMSRKRVTANAVSYHLETLDGCQKYCMQSTGDLTKKRFRIPLP